MHNFKGIKVANRSEKYFLTSNFYMFSHTWMHKGLHVPVHDPVEGKAQ